MDSQYLWSTMLVLTLGHAYGQTPMANFTDLNFNIGEEAQKLGQVLKEFSRRMMTVLRSQSNVDDEVQCAKYKDIISQALGAVKNLDPFSTRHYAAGTRCHRKYPSSKPKRTAFEDMNLFGAYMKVVGDDITDIGQSLIDRGIKLCGNFVIQDGLTDFEKENLKYCAEVFKLCSMKNWKD
uniref:Putative conserved secreted protein n=1 Tax=Rhipicephalus microplus TaxID=6941 RepID=A0A6G5A6G2_RHIMP